jgi:hypothetical protein
MYIFNNYQQINNQPNYMDKGGFLSVIYLENFPSRTEIMNFLTQFFSQNKKDFNSSEYTCVNKANSLSIMFPDSVRVNYFIIS